MTGEEFKELLDFEAELRQGQKVRVRWTNCFNFYEAAATVQKVNRASVVTTLDKPVAGSFGGYPAGWKITVPLWTLKSTRSNNNCVLPANS